MFKKTGGEPGGAGTTSGGAAAASGELERRQEGLERLANKGKERRRGEERKKKKEGGGRLAFKALKIATDQSVANRSQFLNLQRRFTWQSICDRFETKEFGRKNSVSNKSHIGRKNHSKF
ncbi:hypothetical protein JCGZ_26515 [Jatropha curcas]|uniref:Uncharacterized protein n=1 Tax=Jatropha curcas TaxID=180498 RepID=A0A067JPC1_JATCU|nr:hypothetical protein JCGZ_26515 [Jatropha curcas]